MARKKIPEKVGAVLKDHGYGKEAVWDCHGTWVIYHHVLRDIAHKAGLVFGPPEYVDASAKDKICVVRVEAWHKDAPDTKIWTHGEATPYNCKQNYPFAMAEKRARDRLTLQWLELYGLAYGEEEADEFAAQGGPESSPSELHGTADSSGEPPPDPREEGPPDEEDPALAEPPPKPSLVAVQAIDNQNERWTTWVEDFKKATKRVNTHDELDRWMKMNGPPLKNLHREEPEIYNSLREYVTGVREVIDALD